MLELEEVRAELADDNINFMGLATPKRLEYLNFAETVRDLPYKDYYFTVKMMLSRKVIK